MDFAKLADEQREFLDANGYLIVPDALDQETIAQVAAAADRLMDDFAYEGYYQHRRDGLVQDPTRAKLATNSAIIPHGIDWAIAEWAAEHGLSLERAPQRIDAV